MKRSTVPVLALALIVGACGGTSAPTPGRSVVAVSGANVVPSLISSELTKGPSRLLFTLLDAENELVAAPDVAVHLLFYDVDADPEGVVFESDGRFLWAIEGERGLYAANVTYPDAGRWGTRFNVTFPDGRQETVRADYDVAETGTTPPIGGAVPSVDTPTLADVGNDVKKVSTDPAPEPRFYERSIADALAGRAPFVVMFATPAFCTTRICGPSLENVKVVARERPELTFINVEPYQMQFTGGALQPLLDANGRLQAAPWTEAWGLPSEPYLFVVRGDGTLAAKLEGIVGVDELRAAIQGLT